MSKSPNGWYLQLVPMGHCENSRSLNSSEWRSSWATSPTWHCCCWGSHFVMGPAPASQSSFFRRLLCQQPVIKLGWLENPKLNGALAGKIIKLNQRFTTKARLITRGRWREFPGMFVHLNCAISGFLFTWRDQIQPELQSTEIRWSSKNIISPRVRKICWSNVSFRWPWLYWYTLLWPPHLSVSLTIRIFIYTYLSHMYKISQRYPQNIHDK